MQNKDKLSINKAKETKKEKKERKLRTMVEIVIAWYVLRQILLLSVQ